MNPTQGMRQAASVALKMKKNGYAGGTETGWARGRQLSAGRKLSEHDLMVMRAWFARHRHTSYPGYEKWVRAGRPTGVQKEAKERNAYRGAVAWLLWGGDAAYSTLNKTKR